MKKTNYQEKKLFVEKTMEEVTNQLLGNLGDDDRMMFTALLLKKMALRSRMTKPMLRELLEATVFNR